MARALVGGSFVSGLLIAAEMGAGGSRHTEVEEEAPGAQRHEGLLMKESETLKAWNPRFAVLAARVLSYWDTEGQARSGEVPRGRISLENCRVALADDSHPDCFVIETPSDSKRLAAQRAQTVMYFQAATVEELTQWVAKLQRASREPWTADDAAGACPLCVRPFDALVRRHHCRRCGEVVCDTCSASRKPLPDYAYPMPVRVCRECMPEEGPLPPAHERAAARADRAAAEAERRREAEREAAGATGESPEARRARLRTQFNVKRS